MCVSHFLHERDQRINGPIDGWINGPTDQAFYRIAYPQPKSLFRKINENNMMYSTYSQYSVAESTAPALTVVELEPSKLVQLSVFHELPQVSHGNVMVNTAAMEANK